MLLSIRSFTCERVANSKGLIESIPETEIQKWCLELEEDEAHRDIVEFGHWILNNGAVTMSEFSNNVAWKGEYYFRIAKANMSEWQLYIEENILDERYENIAIADLAKGFRRKYRDGLKFPMTTSTLTNFLRDYLYEGRYRLGDIEKIGHERYLVVNRDLLETLPPKEIEEEEEVDISDL